MVGWFAGHPAEPINGVCISPLYAVPRTPPGEPWPLPQGAVHPVKLRDTFADLRIHPGDLTEAELLPFIPRAAEVDQEKDPHLTMLAKILAENCTIHNAATWILQNEPWDFLGVYYNGIDHFCHGFMQFHPPRLEGIPEKPFELYKDVVTGGYRFHDMMLETLLQLAGPDVTVMLVSDHGFHSDHLRPLRIPKEPAGPAVAHRHLGIVCLQGPHIRRDERIYGATLLDVTPTLLTLLGLPVGQDMDGKALLQALEAPREVETIPSWEDEPGECGMHPADQRVDPAEAKAVLDQFVALGYIQPPSEDQAKAVAMAVRETDYNLARAHVDARNPREALPLFQKLVKGNPKETRFIQHLAQCHLSLGQVEEARKALEPIFKDEKAGPWSDLLMGVVRFEEGDLDEALSHLLKAEAANPRLPRLHLRLGNVHLRRGRLEDAGRAFEKALEIDEDSASAHLGMGMVRLRQRRNQEAAQAALTAVGIQHFLPQGHYHLGVALVRLGHIKRARMAFETALSMAPGMMNAHRWLATLYTREGDLDKAAQHRLRTAELRLRRRKARS